MALAIWYCCHCTSSGLPQASTEHLLSSGKTTLRTDHKYNDFDINCFARFSPRRDHSAVSRLSTSRCSPVSFPGTLIEIGISADWHPFLGALCCVQNWGFRHPIYSIAALPDVNILAAAGGII